MRIESHIAAARFNAEFRPLILRPDVALARPEGYARFLSFAAWLQVQLAGENILLPVEKTAKMLGVGSLTVSRYRRWAVEDRYLVEVSEADYGRRRATEFRFRILLFPSLAECAAARQIPVEAARGLVAVCLSCHERIHGRPMG